MAQLIINPEHTSRVKREGPLKFVDFSIIGFQINKSNNALVASIYFLFFNEEKDHFIIKHSYLLNHPDNDMAYFNHPIHTVLNMKKFTGAVKEKVDKLFTEFSHTNSYYTDFKPLNIDKEECIIELIHIDISKVTVIRRAHLLIGDYLKIQNIINSVTFHRPINSSIDRDTSYNSCEIINNLDVTYLGYQCLSHEKGEYFAFFYLSEESSIKRIGLAIPIITSKEDIISDTKKMDLDIFTLTYKENYMIDSSKMLLLPILDNDKIVYKVAINLLVSKSTRKLFITKESILNSKLFNPIKLMMNK